MHILSFSCKIIIIGHSGPLIVCRSREWLNDVNFLRIRKSANDYRMFHARYLCHRNSCFVVSLSVCYTHDVATSSAVAERPRDAPCQLKSDKLHFKSPATNKRPSRSFKVTYVCHSIGHIRFFYQSFIVTIYVCILC